MSEPDGSTEREHTCKIDQTLAELDLTALNERLVSRWRGDSGDRLGVRKLAEYYNKQVLRAVLRQAGDQVRADQAEYLYQLFSADPEADDTDVTVSQQDEWRSTLSDAGVDIDSIRKDHWVSYTTVYSHLTQCLGETAPDTPSSRTVADDMDVMRRLATKSEKIAAAMVNRQVDAEGDIYDRFEFDGDVRIRCDECGYKDTLMQFLSTDGCYCTDVSVSDDSTGDTDSVLDPDVETETDPETGRDTRRDDTTDMPLRNTVTRERL